MIPAYMERRSGNADRELQHFEMVLKRRAASIVQTANRASNPCSSAFPESQKVEAKLLKQSMHQLAISTHGQGLYEFTSTIGKWIERQDIRTGLLTVFCRHTSASLLIQENADPTVRSDIQSYFARLAPENGPYRHTSEGPDDMPAHLKTVLTQVQLSIPLMNGSLVLGTWQGIYLFEHRVRPHSREIVLHLLGE